MVDIEKRRQVPRETFPVKFASTVKELLHNFNCGSNLFPRLIGGVVTVSSDATPLDALQKLIDLKFLSVVVVDKNTKRPIGFFSMEDMLNILISRLSAPEAAVASTDQSFASWKRADFAIKTIGDFNTEFGKMEPLITVYERQPLRDAFEAMIKTKAPRVLVLDEKDNLSNVITRSRLLNLITTMVDSIPTAHKTLAELNLGFKEVFTVRSDIPAYYAFHYLRDKKISSLAVTNPDGGVIGTITVSDIKYFGLLQLSVNEYLAELKASNAPQLLTVHPDDTLATALLQIYFQYPRVHRLFITDGEMRPVGVLSVYDLLAHIHRQTVAPSALSSS